MCKGAEEEEGVTKVCSESELERVLFATKVRTDTEFTLAGKCIHSTYIGILNLK